ncbi:hypothetical protein [Fimbriiglobus ruber]|uniref:hypothetical protein n=1 Tax=Fimbriiglobus ruber TaxID=1908690 RepID=UPI001EE73181|nr:hypothetical protein [Fimbriiglobus ruber]
MSRLDVLDADGPAARRVVAPATGVRDMIPARGGPGRRPDAVPTILTVTQLFGTATIGRTCCARMLRFPELNREESF